MTLFEKVAFVCQILSPGEPALVNQIQRHCHAFYASCLVNQQTKASPLSEEDRLMVCAMRREAVLGE